MNNNQNKLRFLFLLKNKSLHFKNSFQISWGNNIILSNIESLQNINFVLILYL